MALKGLDIFKLTPKKNCKECGSPTCMAFAMKVAQGSVPISKCPYMSQDALDTLSDGTFPETEGIPAGEEGSLAELRTSILEGASWHQPDHYFVLKDFPSYLEAKLAAIREAAQEPDVFARKCLINVASAGKFSSDRTIRQYAREIWNV